MFSVDFREIKQDRISLPTVDMGAGYAQRLGGLVVFLPEHDGFFDIKLPDWSLKCDKFWLMGEGGAAALSALTHVPV